MILKADSESLQDCWRQQESKRNCRQLGSYKMESDSKRKSCIDCDYHNGCRRNCQDDLFKELMEKYIAEAEAYGVDNIQAQMMWCEVEHLGGSKPVKRIFARAKKPYTPDTVYASLILDQKDTSNDNQVGG